MILTQVDITNYKQYGGHQVIDIPAVGAIGVIGVNGVGKTTLFEAIEWALYSPSSIKAADVRPRTWRGATLVKVTLDDPANEDQFIIERELGKGSAKARIYRVDPQGFEEKIVDGASQVTDYVTTKLIGLDHAAFVATFFTRQKELGFFNGSPTNRRRDVGKLLGLQTIRDAQQLIAEDRKRAIADARSYREQNEAALKDRDFSAEIAVAQEAIRTAQSDLQSSFGVSEKARATTVSAERHISSLEEIRAKDVAIGEDILRSQREHDVAQQQVEDAERESIRLANLGKEREAILPIALTLADHARAEEAYETSRKAALQQRDLQQTLSSLERRSADAATAIQQAMSSAPAPDGNPRWNDQHVDKALRWAKSMNLGEMEDQIQRYAQAIELARTLAEEQHRLQSYRQRLEDLTIAEQNLLASGDPTQQIAEYQQQLQEINGSLAAAKSTVGRLQPDLAKGERILANLRSQVEGEVCPTCQRPFHADETEQMIVVFLRDAEHVRQQINDANALIAASNQKITTTENQLKKLSEVQRELADTRTKLQTGNTYVQEQQAKVDDLAHKQEDILRSLGRDITPSPAEYVTLQRDIVAWRKVVDAAAAIERFQALLLQVALEQTPIEESLRRLGEIVYSESDHKDNTTRLHAAEQAAATIQRIDADLSSKDRVITARDTARQTILASRQRIADLEKERSDLGFDADMFQQVQIQMEQIRDQERQALEQRHRQEVVLRDAEHRLEAINAESARIGQLALDAESKQRQADDYDLMYKEFSEFERYAANWYAPRLSEITSELVSQVTDGKYDRVEFDSNFSIQVFDRDDEKYPYETFSGGERDAIALCARIALSRVIGGSSTNPPGFLVLDEVFGSLDLERRQRLLEMLATITGADDHFRQVFIISHVDDVRTSPILDDVWRVVETDQGTSELQVLGVGEDIGEL